MKSGVRVATLVVVLTTVIVGFDGARAAGAAAAEGKQGEKVVWSYPLPDPPWGLAADERGAVVTQQEGDVRALDRNGHVRWRSHVERLIEATPALSATVVLIGGHNEVTALDRASGAPRWRRPLHADIGTGPDADPDYRANVTAVALAGQIALAGDHTGTLAAFDAVTGARRWSVQFDGRLWSAPRIDRARGLAVATWHGSAADAVRVFDLATGALRWAVPTGACTAAAVLRNGRVFVATGDCRYHARVEALDLPTGARQWQTAVPGSFEEAIEPIADAHALAVVDHFGVVTLLDTTTGHIRWQRSVRRALIETRMSLTARRVVLTSFSGTVFVLDRATGRTVAATSARRLGGYPIATATTSWGGRVRLLLALRLEEPVRVELQRLP